jgi:hypothetical protein
MPCCPACHVGAFAVAQSASAVRDLGVPGALSIAAASALGIGYKRGLFAGRVAHSAASDADASDTNQEDQMPRPRTRRPNAALILSTLALILALGGTSYAAFTLPKNSIGTKQLMNGAVTSAKLKNGAVTGSKLSLAGVTVPRASHANTADNATNAGHATTADKIPGLSFIPITLINGWASYFVLRPPEYAVDAQGVVHFEGALSGTSSTSNVAFTMPAALRSSSNAINLTADENGGDTGRIQIRSNGDVVVFDDPEHVGSGESFTSLEGITYMPGS